MNITKIQYKNNYNVFRANIKNSMEKSTEEQFKISALNAKTLLAAKAEMEVPENGKFARVGIVYQIPDTQNIARYGIEYDELEPRNTRRFLIGVNRKGSDMLTSIYLTKGSKKEILEFLNDDSNEELIIATLKDLNNSVENNYKAK